MEDTKKIIENAFSRLTINHSQFIDIEGHKTAEITIPELLKSGIPSIGIGLHEKSGALHIFKINNEFNSNDHRRFEIIFRIGYMRNNPDSNHVYLDMRFIGDSFHFHSGSFSFRGIGDFQTISRDMQCVCCVMKEIESAEQELLSSKI